MTENCSSNIYASSISQKLILYQLKNMFQKLAVPIICTAAKANLSFNGKNTLA
jgi:hypothetical protein